MTRSRKMFQIGEKDEYKHEWSTYQEHHNESWYFNFIDFSTNTHMVTRVGYNLGKKVIETMLLLVTEEKTEQYFNRDEIDGYPADDIYGDLKLKYQCVEPMKKWQIRFNNENLEIDVIFEERFTPYIYMSQEDPREALKKYGMEILKVAASKHYEQGMNATGIVRFIENGQVKEEREIHCYGHRDHSWGLRNWLLIDKWNWIACQFDDCTINSSRIELLGKIITQGFISTSEKHERVTDVEVETVYGFEGNDAVPKSSTFRITTSTEEFTIVSKTSKSMHIQRPTEQGITEVYEQIVKFEKNGVFGYGISEYMKSTRNKE